VALAASDSNIFGWPSHSWNAAKRELTLGESALKDSDRLPCVVGFGIHDREIGLLLFLGPIRYRRLKSWCLDAYAFEGAVQRYWKDWNDLKGWSKVQLRLAREK
jgi:hypothetical protein